MVTAFVADYLLAPEEAHYFDLFFYDTSSRVEVRAQRLVLDRVPAYSHAEAQFAAGEDVHFRCLFGDERGLPLREDDDCWYQFQVRQCRKVAEEDKRFVKHVALRVAPPAGAVRGVGSQNVVERDQVAVTQPFSCLRIVANDERVSAYLVLRKCNSDLH